MGLAYGIKSNQSTVPPLPAGSSRVAVTMRHAMSMRHPFALLYRIELIVVRLTPARAAKCLTDSPRRSRYLSSFMAATVH